MINVIIPASGLGSRFKEMGYKLPKPLIDVNGQPMLKRVVDSLNIKGNYIFLVLKEHYDEFNLQKLLPEFVGENKCEIIVVEKLTEGAACTCLLAKDLVNNDDELIIANSDQLLEWEPGHFFEYMYKKNADGGIITFKATESKWSFVKATEDGLITEVAEKRVISDKATIGVYYMRKGKYFVEAAEQMIAKNIRTNNEFYLCPSFNEMIEQGKKVYDYQIPNDKFWGLGTPTDLEAYLTTNSNGE